MTEELTLTQLGQRLRFLTRKLEVASQTAAVDKAKLINVMARIQAESVIDMTTAEVESKLGHRVNIIEE